MSDRSGRCGDALLRLDDCHSRLSSIRCVETAAGLGGDCLGAEVEAAAAAAVVDRRARGGTSRSRMAGRETVRGRRMLSWINRLAVAGGLEQRSCGMLGDGWPGAGGCRIYRSRWSFEHAGSRQGRCGGGVADRRRAWVAVGFVKIRHDVSPVPPVPVPAPDPTIPFHARGQRAKKHGSTRRLVRTGVHTYVIQIGILADKPPDCSSKL